ncbi:hypothetical protein ACVIIW_006245 [Bradyrhizobium sp. USDA 4449]
MISHARRLEKLEIALAPRGRPFMIWGMTGSNQLKGAQEIGAEIAAARFSGHMAPSDQPVVVTWRTEGEA